MIILDKQLEQYKSTIDEITSWANQSPYSETNKIKAILGDKK